MSDHATVQTFVDLVLATPGATDDEISMALQRAGMTSMAAEQTLAFVPMAFARVVLRGAQFPETYLVEDGESGARQRGRLVDEPVFVAALAFAEHLGPSHPSVIGVAERSAEIQVARQLLRPGQTAASLGFVEPVLMRIPLPPAARPAKPWWRFW